MSGNTGSVTIMTGNAQAGVSGGNSQPIWILADLLGKVPSSYMYLIKVKNTDIKHILSLKECIMCLQKLSSQYDREDITILELNTDASKLLYNKDSK